MQAYLILSHSCRQSVSDLFRYTYLPSNLYFIHVDRKAPLELHVLVSGLESAFENLHVIKSEYCSWGGFSLVAVTMAALRLALASLTPWSHFVILSERHLPLVPAASIDAALMPGISDIQMEPFEALDVYGRMDVTNRFAYAYQELPGVGCFATDMLTDKPPADLHHGSQWMILARGLCTRLTESADHALWRLFSRSLLTDETALQTIAAIAGTQGETISARNRTWIATPARIGDLSMVFGERHFFEARAEGGFLFIRKRPEVLQPAVREVLEAQAAFTEDELAAVLNKQPITAFEQKPQISTADMVWHLRWHLGAFDRDLEISAYFPPCNGPRCYIVLRYPNSSPHLQLCLLSEDMICFKVVLVVISDLLTEFSTKWFFGFQTSAIRARVFGLAYQREVQLGDEVSHGFVKVEQLADLSPLIKVLRRYLNVFSELSRGLAHAPG
jgi:hypothetical protein